MDEDFTPHLQCDIELELSGPNSPTLNKWCAEALRRLADKIERDELESGHHVVTDNVGKPIGKIYVDHSSATF